jgi:hypothetical protein
VSESIGTILMVFILVAFVGVMFGYLMGFGSDSPIENYRPQYAVVDVEVLPALSATDTWDADSIKIHFLSGNELGLKYEEGTNSGIGDTRFMLIDPDGVSHEAVQSVTMHGQRITPGTELFCFSLSSDINGQYYITNAYSRIGDDSTWDAGLLYPKPLSPGTWQVQIIDDSHSVLIADEVVTV